MTILVFADSHKDIITMETVVDKVHPNMIIHLGDHIDDAISLAIKHPDIHFEMVKGNCDECIDQPCQNIIQVDSLSIFITHGDIFNVGDGIGQILNAGKQEGAQIILHGHTHIPSLTFVEGITIMNPGRIGQISSKKISASFGLIETIENSFKCSVFFYDFLSQTNASEWQDFLSTKILGGSKL